MGIYPKQDIDRSFMSQGHTDSRVGCRNTAGAVATSVALLIELKAQVL